MANLNTVYHYCSIETFMAIIQYKTLRLSDLNKTNDYMEKRWANQFIESVLKDNLKEEGIKIDLEENYWYEDGVNNHLQYYKKNVKRVLNDKSPVLITCFSQDKDKLSQWRGYGDDGRGVAIGFNYKKIKQLQKNSKLINVDNIIYSEKKQKKELGEVINSVIMYVKNMHENDSFRVSDDFNEYFTNEFDVFCEVFQTSLDQISCFIKNPAFSEEREVRVVYKPGLPDPEVHGRLEPYDIKEYFEENKQVGKYNISPIKLNYRNNQLVAFCDVNFSNLIYENIIEEIVIGPKSKIEITDVYYFLLSNGYDGNNIRISKSEATYR